MALSGVGQRVTIRLLRAGLHTTADLAPSWALARYGGCRGGLNCGVFVHPPCHRCGLFFGFTHLTGRAIGAGIRAGGNRWQSGKNEANQPCYGQRQAPGHYNPMQSPLRSAGPTESRPPSRSPGWYKDPWGVGRRYWNGTSWPGDTAV